MSRSSLLIILIIVLALILLIGGFAATRTRYWGRAPLIRGTSSSFPPYVPGPAPVYTYPRPTTQPPQPAYPATINYGMSQDPNVVNAAREDCSHRSGRFNECARFCQPGHVCVQACTLACEF